MDMSMPILLMLYGTLSLFGFDGILFYFNPILCIAMSVYALGEI